MEIFSKDDIRSNNEHKHIKEELVPYEIGSEGNVLTTEESKSRLEESLVKADQIFERAGNNIVGYSLKSKEGSSFEIGDPTTNNGVRDYVVNLVHDVGGEYNVTLVTESDVTETNLEGDSGIPDQESLFIGSEKVAHANIYADKRESEKEGGADYFLFGKDVRAEEYNKFKQEILKLSEEKLKSLGVDEQYKSIDKILPEKVKKIQEYRKRPLTIDEFIDLPEIVEDFANVEDSDVFSTPVRIKLKNGELSINYARYFNRGSGWQAEFNGEWLGGSHNFINPKHSDWKKFLIEKGGLMDKEAELLVKAIARICNTD